MIDPITVVLAIVVFFLIYIAFKILKLAVRTLIIGLLGGLTYGGLVYLEMLEFSPNMLLASVVVTIVVYLTYKLVKIPLWFLKKLKNLVFGDGFK